MLFFLFTTVKLIGESFINFFNLPSYFDFWEVDFIKAFDNNIYKCFIQNFVQIFVC